MALRLMTRQENTMLALTLGLVLTAALVVRLGYRGRTRTADLGSMSRQWIAENNAGDPAWSR
jgi:cell division protein FtsL